MSVKIGHASCDENGKIAGGKAGDQKAEVCTRDWYAKGWNVLLRPISETLAEKSARACEAGCANKNIGYDQNQRNTLHTQAKKVGFDLSKIATACECDCSSFMHVCAIAGGANLSYGANGYTTRTMAKAFVASGDYIKLTESKYFASDKCLKRGDILVKEGSHTIMVLSDGTKAGGKVEGVKIDPASSFDKKYAKTYTTKADLNLRAGAGTGKSKITVIPKGAKVTCYGYYSMNSETIWLYVKYGDYVGFCSKKYLA